MYVPSSELGLPNPSPARKCALPPGPKGGGGHTRLRLRGWGSPNSDDWRKSLALCLLCAFYSDLLLGSETLVHKIILSYFLATIYYNNTIRSNNNNNNSIIMSAIHLTPTPTTTCNNIPRT